jgi:hypothetical protein
VRRERVFGPAIELGARGRFPSRLAKEEAGGEKALRAVASITHDPGG